MSTTTAEFGKWRSFFWPVHGHELKKIIPMFLMLFFISFVYSALRNIKDTLIVTAPGAGAEAILFLKVGGVIPVSIVFMLVYAKLSNLLSKEKLFYATILPFLIFFFLFATLLYPAKEFLHPTQWAESMRLILPAGLSGFIAAIQYWTYSLFYIFAELWGSFVFSLLFWGFANDITRVTEAKRFYALFGLGANMALYLAGDAVRFINGLNSNIKSGIDSWQVPLNYLMSVSIICGIIVICIYRWMNIKVLTNPRFYDQNVAAKIVKNKPKMSMWESFKFLAQSRYILCIALLVLSYNIVINLIEVTWKNQLGIQFPVQADYSNFMAIYQKALALTAITLMLFVSSNVLRRFGWAVATYITPVILLITGVGFFSFIIFKEALTPWVVELGTTPLMIAVIFGTIQNVMSRAAKYALFDPTKEMAYIPLDPESKVKGKAVIDTVGARLGKAGGSGIQLGLITIFGSLAAVTPLIGIILLGVIAIWLWAIKQLSGGIEAVNEGIEPELSGKIESGHETPMIKVKVQCPDPTSLIN